jgi:hypothetical protein
MYGDSRFAGGRSNKCGAEYTIGEIFVFVRSRVVTLLDSPTASQYSPAV